MLPKNITKISSQIFSVFPPPLPIKISGYASYLVSITLHYITFVTSEIKLISYQQLSLFLLVISSVLQDSAACTANSNRVYLMLFLSQPQTNR